ncbi:MAG: DUF3179 domain-containing protein [Anaerolineae bacterium]|nr:DUF3179 domain-containing protein [Anaerolineae bacterium]
MLVLKNLLSRWRWVAGLFAAALVALSVFAEFGTVNVAHAQLSCENPPLDISRIVSVWNKTDFCKSQEGVFDEILSGGVPRDGIPPIDDPIFEPVIAAAQWLQPQSPVVAFELNGVARAYPLAILTRHEIVNDVVDDVPVAVTFCPLCNSAIVFERTVDGQVYRFGVSGLLRNSDLIMWDDVTQSWWQQFTGEGIVGQHTGTMLTMLPSQVVSFGAFSEQFPDGEVLSRNGRSYGSNPYIGYDSSSYPFLFQGELDDRLLAMDRVLAGLIGGEPVAYPFTILAEVTVINDTNGGRDVVAFWQPGATSALDQSVIDESRDVGMAALFDRELDGQVLTFSVDDSGVIRDDQTGSRWNVFGTAVEGALSGSQLHQELAFPHFWFAWAAFRPETRLYDPAAAETGSAAQTVETAAIQGDAANGQALFNTFQADAGFACSTCHFPDKEDRLIGPGLLNVSTRAETRVAGLSAYDYIHTSIVDPGAFVVPDFPDGLMPRNWAQIYSEQQINDIIAYLLTLK